MAKQTSQIKYTAVITTVNIPKGSHTQLTAVGLTFREVQDLWERKCKRVVLRELIPNEVVIEYIPNRIGYTDCIINDNTLIHMIYYTNTTS